MIDLREELEKGIEKRYGNLRKQIDEEYKQLKETLKETYTKKTKCEDLMKLFSDTDNFKVYDNKLFSYPVVCIFKNEVLRNIYPNKSDIGMLQHFEDVSGTKMIYPVILVDEAIFNSNDTELFEFVITHELGHYRKNHVSTIYFNDVRRNILKEIEADLYACEIIGIEKCIDGLRALASYAVDINAHTSTIDEIVKRLEFIARKYNITGALDGFSVVNNKETNNEKEE